MLYHVSELLSFYKISSIPLCKYTTFCLSIHLLRNIGVVSNLTIMNNADRNFCVQFLPGCKFPVLMGFHLGLGLLGQKVCLTFRGIAKLFPKVTHHFTFLPTGDKSSNFSTPSPMLVSERFLSWHMKNVSLFSQNLFQRIGWGDMITIFSRGGEKWSPFPSADSFSKPWPLCRVGF